MKIFFSLSLIPTLLLATEHKFVPVDIIAPFLSGYAAPKYSPDENHFAYLAPDSSGAYNVIVNNAFVTKEERGIQDFFWEMDNEHLLYLHDKMGDENYHLYRVNLLGNVVDLTPYENTHVKLISLSPKRPHEALIAIADGGAALTFYRIDLVSQELTPFLPSRDNLLYAVANTELEPLAVIALEPDGKKSLELYQNGSWNSVWEFDITDQSSEPFIKFSPPNTLYVTTSTGLEALGIYKFNIETGEKNLVFSHPKLDVIQAYFDPKIGLQAALVQAGSLEWHYLDPLFEADMASLYKLLPDGEIVIQSRLAKDHKWLILYRLDDKPNAYYLWDRDTKTLELVLQDAPELLAYSFGKMQSYSFTTSDGLEVQGYILIPPIGEPPYATILCPHGGPSLRDTWDFIPYYQLLANRGYALLFVNYRGSEGFGSAFFRADHNEWGYRNYQDLLEAKEWAIEQGLADPTRIAIEGRSFGGYLALLGATLNPDDFVCAIAQVPVVDPKTWLPDEYTPYELFWANIRASSASKAKTPLDYAHNLKIPLLMTHGENDLRVSPKQSKRMADALTALDIPFTYITYPHDGHRFRYPNNRRNSIHAIEEFLTTHMPAEKQPLPIVTIDSPLRDVLHQKTEAIQLDELSLAKEIGEQLILALQPYQPAAGLAAPQIGISKSVFIFSFDRAPQNLEIVINPSFIPIEETKVEGWEGCFSVILSKNNWKIAKVPRYESIRVTYLDVDGNLIEKTLEGFAAKVFQHEYDHLQGIENIDRADAVVKTFDSEESLTNYMQQVKKEDSTRYKTPN